MINPNKFNKPTQNNVMVSKEFCYLIGVGLGDGSLTIRNYFQKRKIRQPYQATIYKFKLITKDKDFALRFKKCLEREFNIKLKLMRYFHKQNKRYYYEVALEKRKLVLFLKKYLDNLKWVFTNLPKELQLEILRGLFDSEGWVNVYRKKYIRFGIGLQDKKKFILLKRLIENQDLKYTYNLQKPSKTQFGNKPTFVITFHKNAKSFYQILKPLTIQRKDIVAKTFYGVSYV